MPVANTRQSIDLEFLVVENSITELWGQERLRYVQIDTGLVQVRERMVFGITQLHPEEINRHHEAAFINLHRNRYDAFEVVKQIAERHMNAGVMPNRTDGPVQTAEPAINRNSAMPVVAGRCRRMRTIRKCGRWLWRCA